MTHAIHGVQNVGPHVGRGLRCGSFEAGDQVVEPFAYAYQESDAAERP